jgi:hypothetical protein
MYCIHDIESKMYQTHNYFAEIAMYLPWGLTINYQLYTGDIVQLNDHDLKFVTYKIEYEKTHTHTHRCLSFQFSCEKRRGILSFSGSAFNFSPPTLLTDQSIHDA